MVEIIKRDNNDNYNKANDWDSRIFFCRQLLICSSVWTCYFMIGLCNGAATVFIPQMRREANSTDAVSEEMASWLPALNIYSGVPWVFILPIVIKYIGRKWTYTLVCFSILLGFVVFYFSSNITQIAFSTIVTGINSGAHFTVYVMIITEYTSPKYRGMFLTVKSASFFWGLWVSNTIGTFFHWKNIGLFGILCAIYSLLMVLILPESPYWLATRGRFEECARSHRWLMGTDKQSEIDLKKLMDFQKSRHDLTSLKNVDRKKIFVEYFKVMSSRQFYMPILLSTLVFCLYVFSGKVVCSLYALDIIGKITNDHERTAYAGMLILDGVTVFSMYIGCAFSKILTRRKMLLASSSLGVMFLFIISLYLYLCKLAVIVENKYISIALLTVFSISISCGPMILSSTISGELVSIESRSLSVCCIALCFKILHGTLVKVSPSIFKAYGLHGAFFFYGIMSSIFLLIIYKVLPETKDKTLQEIADCMKGDTREKNKSKENSKLLPANIIVLN